MPFSRQSSQPSDMELMKLKLQSSPFAHGSSGQKGALATYVHVLLKLEK